MKPDKNALNGLRQRIARLEGRRIAKDNPAENRDDASSFLTLLQEPRLHEVMAQTYGDLPAASAFCLAVLCRNRGTAGKPILWCQSHHDAYEFGRPYGPGLNNFGIPVERLLFVRTRREKELLWAAEEGMRSGALGAVVIYLPHTDLTASRRLALTAQEFKTTCLVLRPHDGKTTGAAWTRWQIRAASSHPQAAFLRKHKIKSLGRPTWIVTNTRNRSVGLRTNKPAHQVIEWDHETHCFHMAAPMADRPAETSAADVIPFIRTG